MNVHTPTETLSCSATGRREWRVTPVVVERPLDDTTLSASTRRTRRDAGLSDPAGSLCRSDAPDDGYSHADADIGRADIGPLACREEFHGRDSNGANATSVHTTGWPRARVSKSPTDELSPAHGRRSINEPLLGQKNLT